MLSQVKTDLTCLEPQDPFGSLEQPELQHGRGLTGFSVGLVGTLGRIVGHLRRVRRRTSALNKQCDRWLYFWLSVFCICSLRGTRRRRRRPRWRGGWKRRWRSREAWLTPWQQSVSRWERKAPPYRPDVFIMYPYFIFFLLLSRELYTLNCPVLCSRTGGSTGADGWTRAAAGHGDPFNGRTGKRRRHIGQRGKRSKYEFPQTTGISYYSMIRAPETCSVMHAGPTFLSFPHS